MFHQDQAAFMSACDQTVGVFNPAQASLYARLVDEEAWETHIAAQKLWDIEVRDLINVEDCVAKVAELTDGAIDTIYVCLGLLHSLGVDPVRAWNEVHGSNMSKVCPTTGRVLKDANGKVQKPDHFRPPNLLNVVTESWEAA